MTLSLKPLQTTLIGGLVFLLPLVVVLAVLGQALALVARVATPIAARLPMEQLGGVAIVSVVAIGLLVLICFAAGLLARAAIGRAWSSTFEEKLQTLYPRYTVIKGMAQGLHGEAGARALKPVLVVFDDHRQIAIEIERTKDGEVVVFLPGAPDPWSGSVALLAADRVAALDISLASLSKSLAGIGRGLGALVPPASAPPA